MSATESLFLDQEPIDTSNPTPRYIQLANRLRDMIRSGSLKPGEALPSERSIVTATSLSRVTIRKALELLVREGLLHQRHGSGTYVSEEPGRIEQSLGVLTGFSEDMVSLGHVPSARWLQRSYALPSTQEAMTLGLSPGEKVLRLHRLRLADDLPLHALGDGDKGREAARRAVRRLHVLRQPQLVLAPQHRHHEE